MTASHRPLVSIIVPVYNVERYLDACLKSIRGQTYNRLEIIVVEDCSTDGSLMKLEPHLADPRVRVIQHERNSGLSAARNTGIESATGEFVLFVDSDDAIAPQLVEACLAQAMETGAEVVVFDFAAFQDGAPLPKVGGPLEAVQSRQLERVDYFKLPHFAWLKFIRADLLRDARLRFPVGLYYEDWPFHWDLGFSASPIIALNGCWHCYRQRDASITASMDRKVLDQFKVQQRVLDSVRERGGHAEATALYSKIHTAFWAVLTRIDTRLLSEAVVAAQTLRAGVQSLRPRAPGGIRATATGILLSLPTPMASLGVKMVRGVRKPLGLLLRTRSLGAT